MMTGRESSAPTSAAPGPSIEGAGGGFSIRSPRAARHRCALTAPWGGVGGAVCFGRSAVCPTSRQTTTSYSTSFDCPCIAGVAVLGSRSTA